MINPNLSHGERLCDECNSLLERAAKAVPLVPWLCLRPSDHLAAEQATKYLRIACVMLEALEERR